MPVGGTFSPAVVVTAAVVVLEAGVVRVLAPGVVPVAVAAGVLGTVGVDEVVEAVAVPVVVLVVVLVVVVTAGRPAGLVLVLRGSAVPLSVVDVRVVVAALTWAGFVGVVDVWGAV
jgi:hypothetical protein